MKQVFFNSVLLICFFVSLKCYGQTDSSQIELNRVVLPKNFTQSITIKGTDLEKIPFSNLDEAIRPWIYGYFGYRSNFAYIVDGVLLNDINAYSIYDIQEITLIQNALASLNGATREQHLVVITTNKNKKGMSVAGGTFLVTRHKAYTTFNQYNLSFGKQIKNTHLSVGSQYVRDVYPADKDSLTPKPLNLERLKLRATVNTHFSTHHNLSGYIGYIPQTLKYETDTSYENYSINNDLKMKDNMVMSGLSFRSTILGLTNQLDAAYNSILHRDREYTITTYPLVVSNDYRILIWDNFEKKNKTTYLLKDNLSYQLNLKNWTISPSINFMLRKDKDYFNYNYSTYYQLTNEEKQTEGGSLKYDNTLILLTPSVNVSYKSSFYFQVGVMNNVSHMSKLEEKNRSRKLPFINSTFDVIKFINEHSISSLKIFTSYLKTDQLDNTSLLTDLSNYHHITPLYNTGPSPMYRSTGNTFQLGSTFSLKNDLISISYNAGNRNYINILYLRPLNAPYEFTEVQSPTNTWLHRFGLDFRILKSDLKWSTGLSINKMKSTAYYAYGYAQEKMDNITSQTIKIWTGGIVNRLTYKKLFIGIDLIYLTGERRTTLEKNNLKTSIIDSFDLQNFYAGISFKKSEVYFSSRNLVESKRSNLSDHRKFMGLGIKISL